MKPKLNIASTTFVCFFIALILLAGINALALEFFLYWRYLWLDIPMHALGGIVVALGFLTLFSHTLDRPYKEGLLLTVAVVLTVGTLWEVFEYIVDMRFLGETSHIGDTLLDIMMDAAGGAAGYIVARRLTELDHV